MSSRVARAGSLLAAFGIAVSVVLTGAPAAAAPEDHEHDHDFLAALANAGVSITDPATAIALGQSVCPMLEQPNQNVTDVIAKVAQTLGAPQGIANVFTGVAVSTFCPTLIAALATAQVPIPALPIPQMGVPPLAIPQLPVTLPGTWPTG